MCSLALRCFLNNKRVNEGTRFLKFKIDEDFSMCTDHAFKLTLECSKCKYWWPQAWNNLRMKVNFKFPVSGIPFSYYRIESCDNSLMVQTLGRRSQENVSVNILMFITVNLIHILSNIISKVLIGKKIMGVIMAQNAHSSRLLRTTA